MSFALARSRTLFCPVFLYLLKDSTCNSSSSSTTIPTMIHLFVEPSAPKINFGFFICLSSATFAIKVLMSIILVRTDSTEALT